MQEETREVHGEVPAAMNAREDYVFRGDLTLCKVDRPFLLRAKGLASGIFETIVSFCKVKAMDRLHFVNLRMVGTAGLRQFTAGLGGNGLKTGSNGRTYCIFFPEKTGRSGLHPLKGRDISHGFDSQDVSQNGLFSWNGWTYCIFLREYRLGEWPAPCVGRTLSRRRLPFSVVSYSLYIIMYRAFSLSPIGLYGWTWYGWLIVIAGWTGASWSTKTARNNACNIPKALSINEIGRNVPRGTAVFWRKVESRGGKIILARAHPLDEGFPFSSMRVLSSRSTGIFLWSFDWDFPLIDG